MEGRTRSLLQRGELACHCLLLETGQGLVLVDTGLGLRDVADPRARLSTFFLALVSPDFRAEMTAARQIEAMGFSTNDVRHIVLTHLDFDHAGGLDDFPNATVHLMQRERDYALEQRTWLDRQRFRPQQWSSRDRWRVYQPGEGDTWFGFDRVRPIAELSDEVLMVPLIGHTHGHAGVAVKRDVGWLLLAGDAYFHQDEMDLQKPACPPGLRFYQTMMEKNRRARLWNQQRLRELKARHGVEVELCCSHDVAEFELLSGRPPRRPATKMHASHLHRDRFRGSEARH